MALAATYTAENCAGVPKGAVVRIYTDRLAEDQPAAWANARRVHESIYWRNRREDAQEAQK